MCLWFVRVTVAQRRRQIVLEMQWAANQPPVMAEEDIAALPSEQYKVGGVVSSACPTHCTLSADRPSPLSLLMIGRIQPELWPCLCLGAL